jgi:hypothetical protein
MAVLPCVNPYPRVRPALAVLVLGAVAGLLLAVGASRAAAPAAGPAHSAYAVGTDAR